MTTTMTTLSINDSVVFYNKKDDTLYKGKVASILKTGCRIKYNKRIIFIRFKYLIKAR